MTKLILPVVFWISACSLKTEQIINDKRKENSPTTVVVTHEQAAAMGLSLGSPKMTVFQQTIKVNGLLNIPPQNRASVSSPIGAIVRQITVVQTQEVKKGQLLAVMEHPDFVKMQEQYLSALSQLEFLTKELERQKLLAQANVAALRDLESAQSEYNQLRAKCASLKNQLSLLNVDTDKLARSFVIEPTFNLLSPISGNIALISAGIGSFANPGVELFQIIDNEHIHADLMVYERDIFRVKVGQRILFTLTNLGNKSIEGRIFGIGKIFEANSKTIAVHAEIPDNEKYGLVPGMYLNATIFVSEKKALALPSAALILEGEDFFVFRLRDSTKTDYIFEKTKVLTGQESEDLREVELDSAGIYALNHGFELMSILKKKESSGG